MSNESSLEDIYIRFRANLVRAVARIAPRREIEDIVQETYVKVSQINGTREIRHPRSFLMKTAKNLALDYVKRAESRLSVGLEYDDELNPTIPEIVGDETFEKIASNEEFAHLCEAIRQLPPQCQRVFILKKVYGHSQREIARVLKLSESTVEKQVALGMKRCMYYMKGVTELENDQTSWKWDAIRSKGRNGESS